MANKCSENFDRALHNFLQCSESPSALDYPVNKIIDLMVAAIDETYHLRHEIENIRAFAKIQGESRQYEATNDREAVVVLADACRSVGVSPHVPRLHALLKAMGLPSIPRQRIKDLIADYLR